MTATIVSVVTWCIDVLFPWLLNHWLELLLLYGLIRIYLALAITRHLIEGMYMNSVNDEVAAFLRKKHELPPKGSLG